MTRMILRCLALVGAFALVLLSGAAAPAVPAVVERTCLWPTDDDLARPTRLNLNGTAVALFCGDRFIVTGALCQVQRGPEVTAVPCNREEGAR